MAETTLATASERQSWVTTYFQEYIRTSRFMPYMSNADVNKGGIILTKFQQESEAFRTINIPFIGRLKSAGVTGAQARSKVSSRTLVRGFSSLLPSLLPML